MQVLSDNKLCNTYKVGEVTKNTRWGKLPTGRKEEKSMSSRARQTWLSRWPRLKRPRLKILGRRLLDCRLC